MSARSQPKTVAEALKSLPASFTATGQAVAALRQQSERLATECARLAGVRRESAKAFAGELAETTAGARRSAEAVQTGTREVGASVEAFSQAKAGSVTRLSSGASRWVEIMRAAGDEAGRGLAELDRRLAAVGGLAGQRREELLRQLGQSAACLGLMDHGQREFHGGLTKLQRQFAEHVEIRTERRQSDGRAEALRATEIGVRAMQSGDLAQAEAGFRKAHALLPSPATVFNLALALILAGKGAESQALLLDPALSQCDPCEAQALKALKALQARDYAAALQEAEAGLQLRADHPVLRSLAATAALAAHRPSTAFTHLAATDSSALNQALAESEADLGEPLFSPEQLGAAEPGAAGQTPDEPAQAAGGAKM